MKNLYLSLLSFAVINFSLNAQIHVDQLMAVPNGPPSAQQGNCNVANMGGALASGFLGWMPGDGSLYTWFDISGTPGCALSYPFTLEQVDINIADPSGFGLPAGSGVGTLTFQINVLNASTPGDPCTEPGALIASSGNIVVAYNDEGTRFETVVFNEVLSSAFFIEYKFISWTGPGPEVPSPLWDDVARPLCRQWITNDGGATVLDMTDFFTGGDLGWVDITIDGNGTAGGGPPNDECTGVSVQVLNAGGSITFNGDNIGATDDGQGLLTPQVWEAFTTTECLDIVLDYCGTASVFQNGFLNLFDDCPFVNFEGPDTWDQTTCVDGNWTITYSNIPAGTWYYAVMSEANSMGPYSLNLSGTACAGGGPGNDDCPDAVVLTPNSTCIPTTGDVNGASASMPAIMCNGFTGDADSDLWYSFVATQTSHDIEVTGSTDFDAVVELLEGTCAGLVSLDCADATLEGETEVINATGLMIGNTYYVRVYDYYTGVPPTSTFEICIIGAGSGGPPNDDCTGVVNQALNAGSTITFNGDNTGATDDGQGLGIEQVWESFTTTECLDIVLDYCGTPSVFGNVFLNLFDDCPFVNFEGPDSWEQTSCVDGNWTLFYTNVPAGTWYYPVLTEPGSTGPYTINVSGTACTIVGPPVNDECAGAIELTPNTPCFPIVGSVLGATESLPPIECNTFTSTDAFDVWFSFEATDVVHDVIVTGMGDLDAIVEFFEGTCLGLTSLFCADATVAGETEEINATGLTIGTTYFVRVYAWNGGVLDTDFDICVTGPSVAPPNDDCADAVTLGVYGQLDCPGMSVTGTTSGASQVGADPDCDATTDEFLDVYYMFNSGSNTEVNIELTNILATDLFVEVLDACAGTSVYCQIVAPPHVVPVTMNTDYWIRVFTNTQYGVGGAFDICLWASIPTSIEESSIGGFDIYPNPASSFVTLRNNGASVNANIELMDMNGKVVLTTERSFMSNEDHVLDLNDLALGVYMISLTNNEGLEIRQRLFIK